MKQRRTDAPCPCGRPFPYRDCCERLHDGLAATDAESLMRSRYSAYALGRFDYLLATWHPHTRPSAIGESPRWIGLDVLRHETEGADSARVEFVARYRVGGRAQRLHEISRFVREDSRWYYVDGDVKE